MIKNKSHIYDAFIAQSSCFFDKALNKGIDVQNNGLFFLLKIELKK